MAGDQTTAPAPSPKLQKKGKGSGGSGVGQWQGQGQNPETDNVLAGTGTGNRDWTKKYAGMITSTTEYGSGSKLLNKTRETCDKGGHDGKTPVITFADGRKLYGAQGSKLNEAGAVDHVQLVIDCAGMFTKGGGFLESAPLKYRDALLPTQKGPEVIRLRWPDLSAPWQVGAPFWTRLYEALPHDTVVCCVGSHGRTGTALACLLVASGMDPDLAILTVRAKHCRRAVETPEQEKYIRSLKGPGKPGSAAVAKPETSGTHPAQVPPGDPDDGPVDVDPTMPRPTTDKGDQ